MKDGIKFVRLDVHQETIVVAVAELDGQLRSMAAQAEQIVSG